MVPLSKSDLIQVYDDYRKSNFFFPLIGAVLLGEQEGVVFGNSDTTGDHGSPGNLPPATQIYIEHAFGFAQIVGDTDPDFEKSLEKYLFADRGFRPAKVRLYAPEPPRFLSRYENLKSTRQRFTLEQNALPSEEKLNGFSLVEVDRQNVSSIEDKFGVVSRFWRVPQDFIERSRAVVVMDKTQPAAICYAAAEADGRVEIDVATLPEYRSRGLAKAAVNRFARNCFSDSVKPLWDCFTNNSGSMVLCKSIGFNASAPPYSFFTISKER